MYKRQLKIVSGSSVNLNVAVVSVVSNGGDNRSLHSNGCGPVSYTHLMCIRDSVIADEAVVDIHIRSVIEDVQRAVNIDFEGGCDALCLSLIHIFHKEAGGILRADINGLRPFLEGLGNAPVKVFLLNGVCEDIPDALRRELLKDCLLYTSSLFLKSSDIRTYLLP